MSERRCRICGCDDSFGCLVTEVACHWVEQDLCSVCASLGTSDYERRRRLDEYLHERCRRFREAEWSITCAFCGYLIMGENRDETDRSARVEEFRTIVVRGRVLPVCRECRDLGMPLFLRLGRAPEPWSEG